MTPEILRAGRIEVDEPLRVLSRNAYLASPSDLADAAERRHAASLRAAGGGGGGGGGGGTGTGVGPAGGDGGLGVPLARRLGLGLALANLAADFDVVGVMEEMDAFLVAVALSAGWDPVSLSYKAARVRENAAAERKSHDRAADTAPTSTGAAAASPWPEAGKCSVRARHLPAPFLAEVGRMVEDEQALYLAAQLKARAIARGFGPRFGAGLAALTRANGALASCSRGQATTWAVEQAAHAAAGATSAALSRAEAEAHRAFAEA